MGHLGKDNTTDDVTVVDLESLTHAVSALAGDPMWLDAAEGGFQDRLSFCKAHWGIISCVLHRHDLSHDVDEIEWMECCANRVDFILNKYYSKMETLWLYMMDPWETPWWSKKLSDYISREHVLLMEIGQTIYRCSKVCPCGDSTKVFIDYLLTSQLTKYSIKVQGMRTRLRELGGVIC